ncbi:MAG: hypothetical protein QOG13_1138 [Sphingomonadales bacterium]|jgi:hypothetical protein|nr:hypothetical protein [Sphingomonadales bacterium]MEA3045259.1 hypothetical protein [Sphingomonadales bacterium]
MDDDLKIKLRAILTDLKANPVDAAQMILTCRSILDAWIDSGGSSLDDEVIGFLGIESQTSHILGGSGVRFGRDVDHVRFEPGSPEEAAEIEDCGRWFLRSFEEQVDELWARLNNS